MTLMFVLRWKCRITQWTSFAAWYVRGFNTPSGMRTGSPITTVLFVVAATVGSGRNYVGSHCSRDGKRGSLFVTGFLTPLEASSTCHRTIARSSGNTASTPRSRPYKFERIGILYHRRKSSRSRNSRGIVRGVHWVSGRPGAAGALSVGITPAEMDAEWARILADDDDDEDEDDEEDYDNEDEDDEDGDEDDDDFDEWELPTSGPGREATEAFESEIDRVLRGEDREDYDYDEAMLDVDGEGEYTEENGEEEPNTEGRMHKPTHSLKVFQQHVEGEEGTSDDSEAEEDRDDQDEHETAPKSDEELLLGYEVKSADFDSYELEEQGQEEEEGFLGTPSLPSRRRYRDYLKEKRAKEAAWEEKRKSFSPAHNAYLDEAQRNREAAAFRKELYAKKFAKRKKIFNFMVDKEKQAERETAWACRWPRNVTRPMESLREGEWLEGKVRNVESYGAWVDVGVERDGLLHVRDMSKYFTQRASDVVATRDKISVRVKFVEPGAGKLGLSLVKDDAPVSNELPRPPPRPSIALAEVAPGTELWGFVERVTNIGAYVNVGAEVQGFLHINEVPGRQKGLDAHQVLQKHKRLRLYAKEVDVTGKRIKLTCRRPKSKARCGPPLALTSLELSDKSVYDDQIYASDDIEVEGEAEEWTEYDDESDADKDVDWFYEDREQPTEQTLYTVD